MAYNRGASETHSHMTLASVCTLSNIPSFPLIAIPNSRLLHQMTSTQKVQWGTEGRTDDLVTRGIPRAACVKSIRGDPPDSPQVWRRLHSHAFHRTDGPEN
jgi:hypothetical protein